jgi:CHAT domain-containing protein/tetratricopeptide (TPR) repeat protein
MIRYNLICILTLLILFGCNRPSDDREESANILYERAIQYAERGRYAEAEYAFRNLLDVDTELSRLARVASHQWYLGYIAEERGEFAAAYDWYTASVEQARRAGDRTAEMDAVFAGAQMAGRLGDINRERSLYNDALTITKFFSYPEGEVRASLNLGRIEANLGRADIAQRHFLHAVFVANEIGDVILRYRSMVALARNYLRQKLPADAIQSLREVLALEVKVTNPLLRIERVLVLGEYYKQTGDYNTTLRLYQEAWSMFRETPSNDPVFLELLESLAGIYHLQGRYREAIAHYNVLADLTRDFDRQLSHGYAILGLSDMYFTFGAALENNEFIQQALQHARGAEAHFERLQYLTGQAYAVYQQARAASLLGRSLEATELYKRALSFFSENPVTLTNVAGQRIFEERNSLADPYTKITHFLVDELLSLDRPDEALFFTEKARQEVLADAVLRLGLYSTDQKAVVLADSFTAVQIRLQTLERGRLLTFEQAERSVLRRQAIQTMLGPVRKQAGDLREALAASVPNGRFILEKKFPTRSELQQVIPRDRTLVIYFPTTANLHIFVLTRTSLRVRSVRIPDNRLRDLVDGYRRLIASPSLYAAEDGSANRVLLRQFENASRDVYGTFIAPVEQYLTDARNITFMLPIDMPDIPLHALRTPTGRRNYLAERFRISYLPSASVMQFRMVPLRHVGNIVVMGNPDGNDWDVDYELRDVRGINRDARLYLEGNASIDNLIGERGELLHLATEFHFQPGFPEHSYFSLTRDGSLAVRQIEIRHLLGIQPYQHVILLNTGTVVEGLNALHPFLMFLNGSRTVVVNFWQRDSRAAKWFNENLYSNLSMDMSFNDAFHQALNTVISTPQFSHPYFWAPFFLYAP